MINRTVFVGQYRISLNKFYGFLWASRFGRRKPYIIAMEMDGKALVGLIDILEADVDFEERFAFIKALRKELIARIARGTREPAPVVDLSDNNYW